MGRMLGAVLWATAFLLLGKIISPTAAKALGDGFCASYSYECLVESSCVDNGNGTFRCSCPVGTSGTGFKKELGGGGCTGTCKSTSECPSYSICDLSTTPGVCRCNNGFSGDAVQGCTDINECNLQGTTYKACSVNAMCMNSPGSYSCVCQSHYRGDGYSCQWICSSAADCALGKATCVRPGDYCKCLSGFSGDGITCDDIDECATGTSRCPANTVCVNTIGNYTCKCRPGYALNPDTNTCVALPRHCDERYTWDNKMKSGYFTVDFDFDGPMEPKQVYCDVRAGYAITEIQFGKGESFPRDVPRTAGEDRPVDYGMKIEELRQLVDNSPYCSQIVSLTCTSKYGSGSGTFSWRDGKGNSQTAWGGSSTAGKCACGEMNSCIKGNCNCGNGVDAVDKGIIYNKNLLPIQAISFPSSGGAAGYYEIGRLRCAKQPVDIPRNCHDVKFVIKEKFNLAYPICPDGVRIFMVQCDVETYKHTGVSKALLTNPVIGTTTTNGEDIKYLVDRDSIAALINGSVYCSQRLEYKCRSTRSAGGVRVTSRSGVMSYFPGGSSDLPGSCGCGLSGSCTADSTVLCRCDSSAALPASDFGFILDKSDMPILNVRSTATDGSQYIVGSLDCAEKQFGIEPNCEKYRQGGLTNIDYGLMIDPDGPAGNCTAYPAQCKIDDVQGMTIIRHDNPNGIRASAPFKVVLKYLRASPDQLALLKKRSTYCKQTISLTYSGSISPANIQLKYSDGNSGSVESVLPCVQTRTCAYTTGQGTDSLVLSSLDKVPVTEVSASSSAFSGTASVTMKIGPLECAEIFPDCATYLNFVKTQGVEGEVNIMKDLLTVDPDAEGEGAPFTVSCIYSDSYIDRPVTYSNRITQRPKQGPITQCFTISYQDQGGRNISEGQLAAFVKGNRRCQQSLQIGAQGAPVVNYATIRRCGSNVTEPTLVSALSSSYCECGIHGLCDSGPTAQCNGDAAPLNPWTPYTDNNLIMEKERLPICEVCLRVDAYPTGANSSWPSRSLRYYVGQLSCGPTMRGPGNCQKYRQDPSFNDLKNRTLQYMWFDGLNRPIPVTCIFYPFPPRGEIVMQPPDFLTETVANQATNRNVTYYAVSITYMREVINSANYCNQPVYVFRTSTVPQDADPYGFFSQQQRIQQGVSTRELSADEIATACQEPPFAALCAKYGAPTGLVVTNKDVIPITRMYLKARTDSIVIAIANATCSYVEKDCEAIRKSGQSTPVDNSNYMIDPGQADAIQPFVASCEFTRDQGITKININDTFWQGTGINNDGTNGPFNFQFKNVYANATPAQVNSLSRNSGGCWQFAKYECSQAALGNNNINPEGLLTLYSGNTSNFGTPYSPGAVGCACGALDTCATPDLTCNCDARGPLTSDQGFITDSSVLPVVGFYRNIRSPSGRGRLSLTSVRCGPMWAYDMPKDCIEAYSLGFRYGINYTVSGEYLINPDNTTSSPFLVYCDYSDPTNPVTIVRPRRPRERVPVKNTTRVDYNGGPTDGQLAALLRISVYCYQPVRVHCRRSKFIASGVRFAGLSDIPQSYWSTGSGGENTCTCGTLQRCGGTRSYSQQRATKCNCDIGDDEDRSDAAILSIKAALPFRRFIADAFADGSLNLTVGNLYCASKPIELNECELGFHDCAPQAQCVNLASGYECVCPDGWKGLGRAADDTEAPAANGRQCIDDNECLPGNNPCPPHNSLCANIPGSFICNCTEGYRNVDRLTCEDIDECAEKTHDCDVNAKCANTDGSFRCSCRTGFRGSGKRDDCSPVGQCTCFGDPHCLSFDKAWFHPQGGCENALVQNDCRLRGSATNPCPRFRVSTHHWNRGIEVPGVYAWIKEVKIVFGDNRIVLGQGGTIIVDGKLRSNMWSILSDDRTETIASVTRIGLSKVSMWTSCGLEVTWNGRDAVEILVPTSMMNKTCGMCGNYNGDKSDDWIVGPECPTLEGQQTNRQTLFSNSWTVNASQECTPDCNPSEPEPTCVSQYKADYMCKKLFSETSPFANCLAQMPSDIREGLLFSCQFDLCHTNDTESTVCEVAETIANFCEEQMAGDPIVWRSPHLCGEPDCGVNEEFLICGPSEESTCNAPVSTYYQLCREGCFCVKGFRRQGDECLPESRCGCPYGEDLMKIGSQQVLNNCSLLVTCVGHEDHTEEPYSCSDIEECAIDDGIEACVCKEGTGTNSETGECIPGDHCAGNTECPATSECVTTRTSFYCNCSEGYINVDRTTCKDVNECTEGTSNCAENAECTNLDGGYTCNCATGYSGDGRTECKDNDECTEGTNDCDDNAECTNTDGGYNCTCKDGYSGDGMAGNCRDKDECSDGTNDCDVNAQCTNTEGGYTCACKEGYRGNGKSGNCEDEDECSEGTSDCDVNAKCTNTGGGYTCTCNEGYSGDGKTGNCQDDDECTDGTNDCDVNAECTNEAGGYSCACKEGYLGDGTSGNCKDKDECREGTSDCDANAQCTNTEGGYTCTCNEGYSGNGTSGDCQDNNECTDGTNDCDVNAECTNEAGGYSCACKEGYLGDGTSGNCKDKDECREGTNNCDANAQCTNTEGVYTCTCNDGYSGNGTSGDCQDDDECSEGTNDCDENAECTNEEGGYTCACKDGYLGNGTSCKVDSDCLPGNNPCSENAVCVNTRQSFFCNCSEGYYNVDTFTCKDIDECEEGSDDCDNFAVCINVPGSFECACVDGYFGNGRVGSCNKDTDCIGETSPCPDHSECINTREAFYCNCTNGYSNVDNYTCTDIDECSEGNNDCKGNTECTNVDGGYNCTCKEGYRDNDMSGNCEDEDECSEGTSDCDVNAKCTNTEGGYTCTCNEGYSGDGKTGNCRDNDECTDGTNDCDVNAECTNEAGGYSCACKEGYLGDGKSGNCEDEDECSEGTNNCDANAKCTNTEGGYTCTCNEGYSGNGTSGDCQDDDECSEGTNDCDVNAECTNEEGGYTCACKDGYLGDGTAGSCKEDDDCLPGNNDCSENAVCVNTRESYECNCTEGYRNKDARTCEDIDECEEGSNNCDENAVCTNVPGSYECACVGDYIGDGSAGSCTKDNDCAPESNPCPINAKCVNTRDGFYCNCSEGFRNVDSVSCEDSDECAEGTNDCDVNAECTNEPGTFRCTCFGGYVGDGKAGNCKKDDDCKEGNNSCPKNSVCVNTPDGFSCNCTEGYHNVDAVTCEDEDECAEGSHDCDVNAECTNLDGSYQCACNEGYTGDGTFGTCIKPDLCKDISCTAVNTECRNGVCVCKEGYELDCEECKDIDECANSPDTCGHIGQVCINTPGSYRCECVDGFYADGGYCHDINECEDGSAVCGQHSECVNMLGAYDCVCCMGYSKHGAACRRDYNLDRLYGAPGLECCNCPGGNCDDPIPVCASDGRSHANYAAMVVDGCRRNKTVEVSYKGYCKTTCSEVECDRPFQKCVETEIGAQCACPVCDVDATKPLTPVCGSNGRIYQSECLYQLTMCSMGQRNVQLRPLTYCNETHPATESPLGPWSTWSECSPKCGKGHTTRSRTASGPTAKQLTQRAVCYTPCENGPCEEDSCPNPGQVCEVGDNNEAVCTCPDCTGQSEEPVCALLGELVRTFENECQLRRSACELTKPYRVLEARACEDTPPTCTKTNYIPELVEGDCVATLPEDLGFCYGKCGQNPAWCCRPEGTETVNLNITFECEDGSSRTESRDFLKIQSCSCAQESQRPSRHSEEAPNDE